MKLTDQKIINTVKKRRDQVNEQLNVRPWTPNRRRFRVPLWLTAVPAAAIVGFLFGATVTQDLTPTTQFTARADTIYITREVPVQQTPDTVIRYITRWVKAEAPISSSPTTGQSMAQDGIDYAMLVQK